MALRWLCPLLLALPGAWGDCQRPPRFAFAEPPTPLEESYPVGTSLRYRCRPGYTLAGGSSPLVTCLNTSLWHANPDFCVVKSCRPPDIMNGNFNYTTDLLLGTTIIYTCDTGYRLVGQQTARCVLENNEVFWDNTPYCDIIPCSPPPVIENAQSSAGNQDFTFGMAVTYRCNTGFSRIGDPTIHCTVNEDLEGVWSGPPPECKVVRCKNPEVKNGRKLSGFGTEYTYRDTVTFECYPGYLLNGSSVVTCGADNTWNPPVPTCDLIVVHCGPAPRFPFAEPERPVGESSPAGTQLRYMCKAGYAAAGSKSSVVTCLNDATWSAEPDFCIRQQCTRPMIKNGDVIADNFQFETVVTFTCHPGYELKESFSAKCVVSGNGVDWDTPLPHCERQHPDALCKEPPAIDNGMHNGTKGTDFVPGSIVVYKCKDGFTLAGAASIRCKVDHQHQGVWSKPTPECQSDVPPIGQRPDALCKEPPAIDNGMHNGTKGTDFVHGSVVVYKCKDGFTLAGVGVLRCIARDQYQGAWSKPLPECRGGANVVIVGIFPLLLAMLVMNI